MAARSTSLALAIALASAATVLPLGTFAAPQAYAQAPSNSPIPAPSETVNLTMEQRHVIKEIIIKDMKAPAVHSNATTTPGQVVPSGVALQPIPVEVSAKVPQVRTHSFFVADDKIVIVDPKDNKIAAVVE